MANRFFDWLKQADADLRHAGNALRSGDFEWCCFAARQAAEKASKALYYRLGSEAWGHTVSAVLGSLRKQLAVRAELNECAKLLDRHYVLTRHPNGFPVGLDIFPYTREELRKMKGRRPEWYRTIHSGKAIERGDRRRGFFPKKSTQADNTISE
jgi:HEPN domain-containing protein